MPFRYFNVNHFMALVECFAGAHYNFIFMGLFKKDSVM